MMVIRPTSVFQALGKSQADSLIVATTSFEQRCLGFATFLRERSPEYRVEAALLISYSDRGDETVGQRVRRFAPSLINALQKVSLAGRVERQDMEPYEVLSAFDYFREVFRSLERGASVVVDISTMTKLHVLYLLEAALQSGRVGRLRLVYTRARYGRYDTLSWGAEEPMVLPGFGHPNLRRAAGQHLVVFCGLEPDRCYSVWRRFGQGGCTKVFVDSGEEDLDRCADRAIRLNSFDFFTRNEIVSAFAPSAVVELLLDIYRKSSERNEYLYVSPLTTKWELVATWEFLRMVGRDAAVGVVYAAPGRLNAAGHTRDDLGEVLCAEVRFHGAKE